MASIRDIGERIFKSPQSGVKLLIGGLLPFTIIGIPWVFGYFSLYVWRQRNERSPESLTLPRWEHWRELYRVGLEAFLIALVWWIGPLLVIFALCAGLRHISEVLWPVAHILQMVPVVAGPALFISALVLHQEKGEREGSALFDFSGVTAPLAKNWANLLVAALAWVGLLTVGLPLVTWAVFLGVLLWAALLVPALMQARAENAARQR